VSVLSSFRKLRAIPIGYDLFSGFAFCDLSLFGASFFRKAELSGSRMVIITLVFAILPQTLYRQPESLVVIFSLLFPSSNYTYFVTSLALWEGSDKDVNLMRNLRVMTRSMKMSNVSKFISTGCFSLFKY
jgi:hypothetical protein